MNDKVRSEIEAKDKWRLEDIYANENLWEGEYAEALKLVENIAKFKGKLKNKNTLLECFKASDLYGYLSGRLYIYANMRLHEDASVSKYQEMTQRASMLNVQYSQASSFILPELSTIPDKKLEEFLKDKNFAPYDQDLKDIIRNKKHILSEAEEKILSGIKAFSSDFSNIFEMLDNLEIEWGETTLADGKKGKLSHGNYALVLQTAKDQNVRKQAFETYYAGYKKVLNTIALTYAGNVKKNWFYAKARGHKSCLASALHGSNVPTKVYTNLIENVEANTHVLHRYINLRKKLLGVKTLNMYDLHIPVIEKAEFSLQYSQAYDLCVESCKPLGEEYVNMLKEAKIAGWIDVYESKGKQSGAYSWGPYGTHPYVLLNYVPTANEVFTIAHEMGHAMHSYYSKKTQPISKAYYVTFNAEVASTVNEVLLLKHLVKTTEDVKLKKFLLNYLLDMFRTTLFRQTQFAQFESEAHALVEQNKPLSEKVLSELYLSLNKKYYGDGVEHNSEISFEWARIPHFYRAFYVFQYSTGIISAITIADKILSGEKDAVANYIKFLKAGCSKPPTEILKIAGVDLSKKDAFDSAFRVFENTLDELEKLC